MFNKRIWLTGALRIIAIFAVVKIQQSFRAGKSDDSEKEINLETDVYDIRFANRGGVITYLSLKDYFNSDGSSVDQVIFEHGFEGDEGEEFILRKIFSCTSDDYLIRLSIEIENRSFDVPYLVEVGPQIGPGYRKLDGRNEYRYFSYFTSENKRTLSSSAEKVREAEDFGKWGGIEGKYFTVLGIPEGGNWTLSFDSRGAAGIRKRCSFLFHKQVSTGTTVADTIYFYAGPKKEEILIRYNSRKTNSFGVKDFFLEKVLPRQRLIARFAGLLKALLNLFYGIIPNYGVAIILMALVIRVVFFPLSLSLQKGKERIELLADRVEEIKREFRYDQVRAQQEVGKLYQEHNVRPMGRAWPLLIQLPIIIALYGLLNTHFDLRGAGFLRAWLTDLSAPDILVDFYPKRLPVLGWEALRLLPLIMMGLMLVQSRYTQPPDLSSRSQNIMTILFPVIIFLILYNVPSGLVLYWTVYTFLGILQDLYFNRRKGLSSSDKSRN